LEDTPPRQPSPDEIESLETLDRIDAPTLDRGAARGRAPTTPELSSGQTVGSYRLRRELGRGGFGQVWEAEDVSSGRRVAVKILTTPHASEIDRQRFEREGRLAASVSHPNCVFVFTAEEIGGLPTIVMELVPGGTLQDLMRSSGPLPALARSTTPSTSWTGWTRLIGAA